MGRPTGSCDNTVNPPTCGSNIAGTHTVTGTDGSFSDTATLDVSPGALASIAISPSTATISAGGSQAYTAQGFDSHGNSTGDVTGATTLSISPNIARAH